MVAHEEPMETHEPWGVHGDSMGAHGLWGSMGIMGLHGDSVGNHGAHGEPIGIYGDCMRTSWRPMGAHGDQWGSMWIDGVPWGT